MRQLRPKLNSDACGSDSSLLRWRSRVPCWWAALRTLPTHLADQQRTASNQKPKSLATLVVLSLLLTGCKPGATSYENRIAGVLPKDWHATVTNDVIFLRREAPVWVMGHVSNPPQLPDQTIAQYFQTAGQEIVYELRLRFVPLLPRAEFERLRVAREKAGERFKHGASGKFEYDDWVKQFDASQVPAFFTKEHSIFLERWAVRVSIPEYLIEPRFVDVYPQEAASEIEGVVSKLGGLFHKYEGEPDRHNGTGTSGAKGK